MFQHATGYNVMKLVHYVDRFLAAGFGSMLTVTD